MNPTKVTTYLMCSLAIVLLVKWVLYDGAAARVLLPEVPFKNPEIVEIWHKKSGAFITFRTGLQQGTTTAAAIRAFYFRKTTEVCTKRGYWICSWYSWKPSGTLQSWSYHDTLQLKLIAALGVAELEKFRLGWEA